MLTGLSVSRGRPPLHQRLLDWELEAAGAFGGGKDGEARKGSVEVSGGLLGNADPYSAVQYIGLPTSKAGQDHTGPWMWSWMEGFKRDCAEEKHKKEYNHIPCLSLLLEGGQRWVEQARRQGSREGGEMWNCIQGLQ